MEAHGHEFIEKHLSSFLQNLVTVLATDTTNFKGCNNIAHLHYTNKTTDDVGRAMYLGNWLTDNSQLFAPDFFFDFKYNLPTQLQDMQDVFLTQNTSTSLRPANLLNSA
jgi:hypothetical protein